MRLRSLLNTCLVACVTASACGTPVSVDVAVGNTQPFVGKIWLSTDASAPLGTFRIFLPDGTLVMDSCVETYRLRNGERSTSVASSGRRIPQRSKQRSRNPLRVSSNFAFGSAARSTSNAIVLPRFRSYVRTCPVESMADTHDG